MKWVLLVIIILAWVYGLYTFRKARPSNGYGLAWGIWTLFWGVFAYALFA